MCYGEQDLQGALINFEGFFQESVKYLTIVAGCEVKNMDVLRQLIESFFGVAQLEQAKIKVKIAEDKKLEIQLTEKALAEYNAR
jgi:hypothetical protein